MAAGTFTFYSANKHIISLYALDTADIKLALVDSTYTPDVLVNGDAVWDGLAIPEIAAGDGYTAGGATLGSTTYSAMTSNYGYKFTSNDVTWTASGAGIPAWRYAVMYVSGTFCGVVNPLIGYFLGDNTNIDVPITTSGNVLTVNCPADGWFAVT